MEAESGAALLRSCAAPLVETFGSGLLLVREGESVRWLYDGLCARIELDRDAVRATFLDRPARDLVTDETACAVFTTRAGRYDLSAAGCARMVADMVDFFSGVREPYFVFSDALFVRA